ncbi:DUF2637 domain-containing protein [Rhodococcus sp. 1168]|uniref:DUF2637 domain-containing protein n=1 Tax=Rhodococcus sp. 1168 TaxID=2018041 RepID=UPI000A0AC390|nr:DUF2637 domain-containing protein [Rhodococcus sp. 1168]ORI13411.1 hypothetical protein BJI47_22465 [Rhodococcus sp. 1168]
MGKDCAHSLHRFDEFTVVRVESLVDDRCSFLCIHAYLDGDGTRLVPGALMSRTAALATARWGTVALSVISFAISYIALADLAHIAGLGLQAFLWPLMIDGTIVVGTVAVFAAPDAHSWSLLIASAVVSVAGNGIHAAITQGSWIAVGVALTPPVFLLWVTHMTVRLTRVDLASTPVIEKERREEEAPLEPREEVSRLIAAGELSLRKIAARVAVSDRTVRRWRDEDQMTAV